MTRRARSARHALCATLREVGPDAPTLCSPWTGRDLAAHLAVRDRRPDAAVGVALPAFAGHTASVMESYAARPWDELVGLVHDGPPRWSPQRTPLLDEATNLVEYVIHHEDLLRASPAGDLVGPQRELDPELSEALWHHLVRLSPLMFRRAPTGVVLRTGDRRTAARRPGDGRGTVVVVGDPLELLLTAYGRVRVAQVEVQGSDEDAEALFAAPLGLGG